MRAAAISATHLSRLAEELVLWATPQFGFIRLSDAFSTGSSIMPQKRNPDAAELVRGKTGRVFGALLGLLTVMKGLPLAYSKDMQEDKEGVFDALQTLSLCLAAMAGMIRDLTPDAKRMKAAAGSGYATATDLADWLVRTLKMPFREAHHVTGRIVALAAERSAPLEKLSLEELQSVEPRISADVFGVLGVTRSVKSRTSYGGTAPVNVKRQARAWLKRLGKAEPALRRGEGRVRGEAGSWPSVRARIALGPSTPLRAAARATRHLLQPHLPLDDRRMALGVERDIIARVGIEHIERIAQHLAGSKPSAT